MTKNQKKKERQKAKKAAVADIDHGSQGAAAPTAPHSQNGTVNGKASAANGNAGAAARNEHFAAAEQQADNAAARDAGAANTAAAGAGKGKKGGKKKGKGTGAGKAEGAQGAPTIRSLTDSVCTSLRLLQTQSHFQPLCVCQAQLSATRAPGVASDCSWLRWSRAGWISAASHLHLHVTAKWGGILWASCSSLRL